VNVGSLNDPRERQGIAHFLEHMIFMGSEKYPDEAAFSDHLTSNGGETNAYTENEVTTYHFSVSMEGLRTALDMTGNLFASPVLEKDAMEREIKAVESEFRGVYASDNSRMWELLGKCSGTSHEKASGETEHVFNTFGWGNFQSISGADADGNHDSEALWKDLRLFFDSFYSADRMSLVV